MAVISGPSISLDADHARRSLWAPSLPLVLGLAMFVFFNNASGLPLLGDPDSHWHIALGNWILTHGTVPTVDTFSFTFAGQPWIAKEWLSQVLMALAFNFGGWGGVTALASAALATTFALLLRLLLRDLRPLPALLLTVAAAIMTAPHFLARPHILAFPFILWWVAGLVRAVEQRRAPEPILLVAMLFWANMHGGFTLGLVLAGALALDALVGARDTVERRALFISWARFGIAAVLVACITPYGPESILVTVRIFGLGDALSVISEWRSPDFQNQVSQELVLLVALYLALSRGVKLPLIRLLIVIGLVHLFLRYARNAELLATLAPLVIAPVLARQFPALVPDARATTGLAGRLNALARPAGVMALALAVAVGAVFAGVMIRLGTIEPPSSNMPTAALAYARDNGIAGGRVLNHYNFGGYLIRAGVPTFIDGRGELYGGEFIKKYAHAVNLKGDESFEAMLDRWQIDWTLLTPEQAANQLLARLPGWRRAYADEAAVIYVRERQASGR